jgi:hypothetical protein
VCSVAVRYALEQLVFLYDIYSEIRIYVGENFDVNFMMKQFPAGNLNNIVNKLRTMGLLLDKK